MLRGMDSSAGLSLHLVNKWKITFQLFSALTTVLPTHSNTDAAFNYLAFYPGFASLTKSVSCIWLKYEVEKDRVDV